MKKKLLTVLLAVVMVFGVFGLTACGAGTNPDEEYNYYKTKYALDGEVKIDAVTYQGVYRMFTYGGRYLLYIDTEGEGAADRFQKVNEIAQEWQVPVYHFNPDLSGGYAANHAAANGANTNIITDLTGINAQSQIKTVQDNLISISKQNLAFWKTTDGKMIGIKNGSVATRSEVSGVAAKAVAYAPADCANAIAAVALQKPSWHEYQEGDAVVPASYDTTSINTMNLFADARLHMYEDGVDALNDEKTDVYVTVANYGMFEHLMKNNKGYFAVFFGGTWCPNTQAIAKAVNDLAKDYGISKVYFFDPRLDDGTKPGADNGASGSYLASVLNTRTGDSSAAWAALTAANKQSNYVAAAKALLAKVTVAEEGFADKLLYEVSTKQVWDKVGADGYYTDGSVATLEEMAAGGRFITEVIDEIQDIADDAVVAEAKALSNYDALLAAVKEDYTSKAWTEIEKDELQVAQLVIAEHNATKDLAADKKIVIDDVVLNAYAKALADNATTKKVEGTTVTREKTYASADAALKAIKDKAQNDYVAKNYNYNYLYAAFLDECLPTYQSQWNHKYNNTGNAFELTITSTGKTGADAIYTRMAVPNMMLFNGEKDGVAELVALAEAEYTWNNVSVEGSNENVQWTNAVKAIFDKNPYASYNPIPVIEVADDSSSSSSGSSSSSSGAASSGGDAC